jgi:hypothetical protein
LIALDELCIAMRACRYACDLIHSHANLYLIVNLIRFFHMLCLLVLNSLYLRQYKVIRLDSFTCFLF